LLSIAAQTSTAANPTAAPSPSGRISNPATAVKLGAFVPTQSLPAPRWSHCAVTLRNGKVLIAGGVGNATNADGVNIQVDLDTAVLYDPSSGGFQDTGRMIIARMNPTATVLNDGRVLIIGGGQSGPPGKPNPGAELYDPSNGTFAPVSNVSQRVNHTATLLRDGRVLIAGGIVLAEGSDASSTADIYDPAKGVFKPAAKMKSPRCRHSATLLLDGRVLIAGGSSFLWNVAGRDRSFQH
jgi:hypothetical protein